LLALALIASGGVAATAAHASGTRLQGSFRMRGTITLAEHVYGEHRGQHVVRIWTFSPHCDTGGCRRITLTRRRARRKINVLVLRRRGPGLYVGRGHFRVALNCAGHIDRGGGLALERIRVRIVHTLLVNGVRYATALRASYSNPSRRNLTACPGGIGRDAARYRGALVNPFA
jgi:hypothetical protein